MSHETGENTVLVDILTDLYFSSKSQKYSCAAQQITAVGMMEIKLDVIYSLQKTNKGTRLVSFAFVRLH